MKREVKEIILYIKLKNLAVFLLFFQTLFSQCSHLIIYTLSFLMQCVNGEQYGLVESLYWSFHISRLHRTYILMAYLLKVN